MSVENEERGIWGGLLSIVALGVVLGVGYNLFGLSSRPAWGLPWIGEDRRAAMPALADVGAAGTNVGYGVSDDPMALGSAAQGLPDVPQLDRPIEAGIDAVQAFVQAGAALIIDAREVEEYVAGHIPGAVNIPYDEAHPDRLERIDGAGRPIIVYCGGGTCELSMDLAYDLIYAGHSKVLVYMGGYPEWVGAGHPVTTGEGR